MKRFSRSQICNALMCIFIAGGVFLLSFVRINPNTNTPIIASEHTSIEQQTVETYANKYRHAHNQYYGQSSLVKLDNERYPHVYLNLKSFGKYQPQVKKLMLTWNHKVGYDIFKNVATGISLQLNYSPKQNGIVIVNNTHNLKQGNYLTNMQAIKQDQISLTLPIKAKTNKALTVKLIARELKHCLGIKSNTYQDLTITANDLATIYHSLVLI